MKVILAQKGKLSVVIEQNSYAYKPLIMFGTTLYDPTNDLRPTNCPGAKKLHESLIEEARELYREGRTIWEETKQQELTPKQSLEELIATSVAQIAVDDVVNIAKPAINKYITETYGLLPKIMQVKSPKGTHTVKGITHEKYEQVLNLVNADIPVFLTGPAGSGKNVICKQVSEALGLEFYFSNAVTQEYKLTGFIDANGNYQGTQFHKAFAGGGCSCLTKLMLLRRKFLLS